MIVKRLYLNMENWAVSRGSYQLGYIAENQVTLLQIATEIDPNCTYHLEQKINDESYILYLEKGDGVLTATIPNTMLTNKGNANWQIVGIWADNSVKKSNIFSVYISDSINAENEVPASEITAFTEALADLAGNMSEVAAYAESASASASNASTSASNASESAESASAAAESASASAESASTSAESASIYATNASASASEASTHATNASESATNASESASEANTSARNAGTSASEASASADEASEYATNASASATTATEQASLASSAATSAQTYAANASTSEQKCAAYASNVYTKEETDAAIENAFIVDEERGANNSWSGRKYVFSNGVLTRAVDEDYECKMYLGLNIVNNTWVFDAYCTDVNVPVAILCPNGGGDLLKNCVPIYAEEVGAVNKTISITKESTGYPSDECVIILNSYQGEPTLYKHGLIAYTKSETDAAITNAINSAINNVINTAY
jgi:hypothetical protein